MVELLSQFWRRFYGAYLGEVLERSFGMESCSAVLVREWSFGVESLSHFGRHFYAVVFSLFSLTVTK